MFTSFSGTVPLLRIRQEILLFLINVLRRSVLDPHKSGYRPLILYSDPGIRIRIQRGEKSWRRQLITFNKIFQNDIKKTLLNTRYYTITKGSLLLCFQFCIHLLNLYRIFSRLFYLLNPDPDSGGISLCRSVRIRIQNTDPPETGYTGTGTVP